MPIPLFVVDAFTARAFGGNPAAVCVLERFPDDALLQKIAAEHNLSETAFLVREGEQYALRWFTPAVEVPLCGHATLASAHVVLELLEPRRSEVAFRTRSSGVLGVKRATEGLQMSLPVNRPARVPELPPELDGCIDQPIRELHRAGDYIALLENEAAVRALKVDLARVAKLPGTGFMVTAPGKAHHFVSRYFGPQVGIPEDPVTGSAHCALTPLWVERLGRARLRAHQASARGGELLCELAGERVLLTGRCALYARGEILA